MSFNNDTLSGSVNRAGFRVGVDQFDLAKRELGMSYVLAADGVPSAIHTGTLAETLIASIAVPGGLLGPNGRLRLACMWKHTSSANAKQLRAKLGGSLFVLQSVTTTGISRWSSEVWNAGAANSQTAFSMGFSGAVSHGSAATPDGTYLAIDTDQDTTLDLFATLTNIGESIQLMGYMVEVFPTNS